MMTTKPGGLISQLLTADELVRWPLMHGTLAYGDELNGIKANGLIAGRATNFTTMTRQFDECLRVSGSGDLPFAVRFWQKFDSD